MRQTACVWRSLPAMIDGGTHGRGPHVRHMKRREFITLFGGAAAAWPLSVRGQQAKPPTIGFMGESTPEGQRQWVAAFVQRLGERGWNEGRNVTIEYRWAGGHNERFAEIVADLLGLKVDVIVTQGTPAVLAAKNTGNLRSFRSCSRSRAIRLPTA